MILSGGEGVYGVDASDIQDDAARVAVGDGRKGAFEQLGPAGGIHPADDGKRQDVVPDPMTGVAS